MADDYETTRERLATALVSTLEVEGLAVRNGRQIAATSHSADGVVSYWLAFRVPGEQDSWKAVGVGETPDGGWRVSSAAAFLNRLLWEVEDPAVVVTANPGPLDQVFNEVIGPVEAAVRAL